MSVASSSTASRSAATRCASRPHRKACGNTGTLRPPFSNCWVRRLAQSSLLAAALKFDRWLTLELQGKGLVNLLVAQSAHDFKVRAIARTIRSEGRRVSASSRVQDSRRRRRSERPRVQLSGMVPITGNSLADPSRPISSGPNNYLRVLLGREPGVVAGMLVQRIPGAGGAQAPLDAAALDSASPKADAAMSGLAPGQLLEDDVDDAWSTFQRR